MGGRRPNPRLIKLHRSHTVEEVARVLGVHKNTVRGWIKQGLPTVDKCRPTLIIGRVLVQFLIDRRRRAKRPCGPGQIYCVRCREPKLPAGRLADVLPVSSKIGDLQGICPDCETLMHRRVSIAGLDALAPELELAFPKGDPRLSEPASATLNCDSSGMLNR